MEENKKTDSVIRLIENGPMIISGSFDVKGSDGVKIEFTPLQMSEGVALCRCGRSQHKPICDGTHAK